MAEAQLRQFLEKVRQLNAFVALSEADPQLRQQLCDCEHHDQVVALARRCGFEIGRRWGESPASRPQADEDNGSLVPDPAGGRSAAAMGPGSDLQPAQAEADRAPHLAPAAEAAPLTVLGSSASAVSQHGGSGSLSERDGCAVVAAEEPASSTPSMAAPAVGPKTAQLQPVQPQIRTSVGGIATLRSLLSGPCPPPGEEIIEVLIETPQWRLERIHSCSSRSPDGFWYDQQEDEWVLLLQGTARLRCADQPSDLELAAGDSLWLRAGRRHRVTATDPAPGTIWLAVFWRTA